MQNLSNFCFTLAYYFDKMIIGLEKIKGKVYMKQFDVVIIGGGPSGTSTGAMLVKNGYSTLIIDKHTFPRKKLCAGGVTLVKLLPNKASCAVCTNKHLVTYLFAVF